MNAAVYALAAIGALYLLLTFVCTVLVMLAVHLDRDDKPQPAVDDAVTMLKRWDAEAPRPPARKPQAAPWPDGDTVVTDGMADAINRMLRGDGAK